MYIYIILAIMIFIGYQIWKSNKFKEIDLEHQQLKESDEILKQKFPHIFCEYQNEIRTYYTRLKRAEKSPNAESYRSHWADIHMELTDQFKVRSTEYVELDKLRLETGKLMTRVTDKFNEEEIDFLSYKLWDDLSEFEFKDISHQFHIKANSYFPE